MLQWDDSSYFYTSNLLANLSNGLVSIHPPAASTMVHNKPCVNMDRTMDTPSLRIRDRAAGASGVAHRQTHPRYSRAMPVRSGFGLSLSDPRTRRKNWVNGVRRSKPDKARCCAFVCPLVSPRSSRQALTLIACLLATSRLRGHSHQWGISTPSWSRPQRFRT